MSIIDTYDNLNFTFIIVFLFIFLFSFISIIMLNIKSRNIQNPQTTSNQNNKSNTPPILQCVPRPTLIGNVMQMTC